MTPSAPEAPAEPSAPHAPWSLPARIAFRFSLIFWALWMVPSQGQVCLLDYSPLNAEKLELWIGWPLASLSHWVGVHLFHLTGEAANWHPTGSGDTAMNYVQVFCILVLATVGSAAWSAMAESRRPRRREYRTAYAWLRLLLRFTLAATLISYGFAKVFPSQFGLSPRLLDLNETYGESSPMHILWFFMGVSRPYTIFGGLAEVVPGFLLLFRRTTTLGLLASAGVMTEVVALNFFYDVPVKVYSTHLLLLSLFLLLPDLLPMMRFFLMHQPAMLNGVWVRKSERRPLRIAAHVLQGIFFLCCLYMGYQIYASREMPSTPSPIRGMWAVDSVTGWPDKQPKILVLDSSSAIYAVFADNTRQRFPVSYNAAQHILLFPKMERATQLHWTASDPRHIHLQGAWSAIPVALDAHRTDPDSYPLLTRGFHWVQENPFNR